MAELEEKLNSILSNPQMMQQIMAIAQSFGQQDHPPQESQAQQSPQQSKQVPQPQQKSTPPFGKNEVEMVRRLSSLAQQTGLDRQQQNLIRALQTYLGKDRLGKLEKAMHAAKIAKFASSALDSSGGQLKFGR